MSFGRKSLTYSLENYPAIMDFATMLEHLRPGGHWNGSEVYGDTINTGTDSERFGFRHLPSGVQILSKPVEWRSLKDLFLRALSVKEIQPLLSELSVAYGNITADVCPTLQVAVAAVGNTDRGVRE